MLVPTQGACNDLFWARARPQHMPCFEPVKHYDQPEKKGKKSFLAAKIPMKHYFSCTPSPTICDMSHVCKIKKIFICINTPTKNLVVQEAIYMRGKHYVFFPNVNVIFCKRYNSILIIGTIE